MLAERASKVEETSLGPFEVAADPAQIAAFAAASGAADAAGVPATFPIVWLANPELMAALRALAGADRLPVHESQSFAYARALTPGARYRLSAVARQESAPERLVVEARVTGMADEPVLEMRAVLRLVPIAGRPGR